MEYLRRFTLSASAGENFLYIELPSGKTLRVVNLQNGTTAWLRCGIYLGNLNLLEAAHENISLVDRVIQCGIKDVHWEGEIKLKTPYLRVEGKFEDCEAGDNIYMTVGYE